MVLSKGIGEWRSKGVKALTSLPPYPPTPLLPSCLYDMSAEITTEVAP